MMTHHVGELIHPSERPTVDSLELDMVMACRLVGRRQWSSAVTVVANRRLTDAELERCRTLAWRCGVDLAMETDGSLTVRPGRTVAVPQARP